MILLLSDIVVDFSSRVLLVVRRGTTIFGRGAGGQLRMDQFDRRDQSGPVQQQSGASFVQCVFFKIIVYKIT